MKPPKPVLILFLALVSLSALAGPRSWGGDGPNPLIDLPVSPNERDMVPSRGVQDFILWEKTNQILFRDEDDELRSVDLNTMTSFDYDTMKEPISRVVDPFEQLVIARGVGRIFRALEGVWHWFVPVRQMPMQHLFWARRVLFSIGQTDTESGSEFHIFAYDRSAQSAREICTPFRLTMGDAREHLQVAQGSAFPDVYVYKSQYVDRNRAYTLWFRHYDISKCQLSPWYIFRQDLPGAARAVFRFPSLDSFAVSVDHPHLNLSWDTPKSHCYYDLGTTSLPLLPGPLSGLTAAPVLATFDEGVGLRLIYPAQGMRRLIVSSENFTGIDRSNIWLTQDGARLFVAPFGGALITTSHRKLVELDLPPMSSSEPAP